MQRLNSQVSLSCAECNMRKKLKYRCMECKVTICENCKEMHSNFQPNLIHTVLSFDDITSYNCTENQIRKMPCKKHVTKQYSSFCQTCKFLICEDCYAEGHSYHIKIDIDQFLQENFISEDKNRKPTFRRMSSNDTLSTDCPDDDDDDDGTLSPVSHSASAGSLFMRRTVEMKVIKSFNTKLPAINCIEIVNEEEAIICHYEGDIFKIRLIPTLITNRLRHIDEIRGLTPADIAVNSVGDIYFICKTDNCIKLVKKNNHNKIQVSSLPKPFTLEPLCIHCETDHDSIIWIGLAEFGANYKHTYNSSRQIVSILSNGNLCNIFEYSDENQPLFTLPWRITSNEGRIYVIDRKNESTGTVVALNKYGNMKWRYSDLHPSLSQRPFLPSDVVVTKSTNIIVLDSANNALHILSYDGNLILQQSLESFEIEYPISMKFDASNCLWIGSGFNGIADSKAKLYKFQITGI